LILQANINLLFLYINRIKTKTSAKATIAEEKNEKEKKNTEKTEKKQLQNLEK